MLYFENALHVYFHGAELYTHAYIIVVVVGVPKIIHISLAGCMSSIL